MINGGGLTSYKDALEEDDAKLAEEEETTLGLLSRRDLQKQSCTQVNSYKQYSLAQINLASWEINMFSLTIKHKTCAHQP